MCLRCEVETVNGDPFGPFVGGRLRMRGYMLPLAKERGSTEVYINVFWSSIRSHQRAGSVGGIKGVKAADQLVCHFDLTPEEEEEEETFDSGDDVDSEEEDYPNSPSTYTTRNSD
jgi:hypothetical protein